MLQRIIKKENHLRATEHHHQIGSHRVTCHLTQVNVPAFTPARRANT